MFSGQGAKKRANAPKFRFFLQLFLGKIRRPKAPGPLFFYAASG